MLNFQRISIKANLTIENVYSLTNYLVYWKGEALIVKIINSKN